MTAEQLQAARAAHWRQNQRPILTLDDAESWLAQHPLCLFLPRRAQLPAPAPSFVEACAGSAQATPPAAAIEQAQALLSRLIAADKAVALNLLGAVTEQPDFLAHPQALPYVLCLRADADWKHAPQKSSGHKVSPLVLELWKALDKEGVLTASQAQEILGRELTEAAVMRALCELWQGLRISPVFEEPGRPARWELLRVRHRDALTTAGATSQVTALSLLVSMYLQSVYAASSEEIEIFLSPVASRSRVREAVRGLSATRQIHSLSMDAQTYYFLEEGLPEFAELATVPPARVEQPRLEQPRTNQPRVAAAPERPRRPLPSTRPVPSHPPTDKPARRPTAAPFARPGVPPAFARKGRPEPRPAQPAARTEWKGARPAAAPGRPSWQPSAKPAEGGGRWPSKGRSARPPQPAGRSFSPADKQRPGQSSPRPPRAEGAARGGARPDSRGPARPDPRGSARPERRPGAWAGNKSRPAPWTRPDHAAGSPPRPPHAAGRGGAPYQSGQRPRSGPTAGAPRDLAPGRASGPPPAGARPPSAGRPATGRSTGRPGGRPGVGFRTNPGRSGPPRSGRPGSSAGRTPDRNARPYDRPRPGGYRKPDPDSGAGGAEKAARPASAAPGSRPPRSWSRSGPRPGGPSGRPGGRPTDRPSGKPTGRPTGRPSGKSAGRPAGRSAGRPAGKSGKPPGSFRSSKPARKKPGL